MFISHKSNVIQHIREDEWDCRRMSKGMSMPEYWAWEATITSGDPPVITYPSEDFTIVRCTDEDVQARIGQLGDYISSTLEGTTYNIKYYVTKRDSEIDGVKSHFIGDDTAKDKRILDQKRADIRTERNRLLTESDWVVVKAKETHANASIPSDWVDYRTELRDITKQSDPDDITWPTKP